MFFAQIIDLLGKSADNPVLIKVFSDYRTALQIDDSQLESKNERSLRFLSLGFSLVQNVKRDRIVYACFQIAPLIQTTERHAEPFPCPVFMGVMANDRRNDVQMKLGTTPTTSWVHNYLEHTGEQGLTDLYILQTLAIGFTFVVETEQLYKVAIMLTDDYQTGQLTYNY